MGQGILWGPLVLFAMAMSFTPGPNGVMVTASAANFGFCRVIPHMIGITLGFGLLTVATGIGLSGLFQAEPRLHTVLKYAGAAYLLYLAWRISQSGPTESNSFSRGRPINLVEAVLFQWINPKGWIMAVGALAAYTVEGSNAIIATILRDRPDTPPFGKPSPRRDCGCCHASRIRRSVLASNSLRGN